MSDQTINAAIRKGGVVWHPCETCGRDWPFPKGPFGDDVPREWSCAVCANALHAKAIRTSAALSASGAGEDAEAIRLLLEVYQTHRNPWDAEYETAPCDWCRAVEPLLAGVDLAPPQAPETP